MTAVDLEAAKAALHANGFAIVPGVVPRERCDDILRPQTNWNATLSSATIAALSPQLRQWLGLGPSANVRLAAPLAVATKA